MATNVKYGLTYDVIIIGSGVAGALMAYRLAQANARVLILEAGGMPTEMPSKLPSEVRSKRRSEQSPRGLLVRNYAASSSKGQDAPYTDEVRHSQYYSSPPAATAPQPEDEQIDDDPPYYTYENPNTDTNHKFKSYYERLVGGSTWHWQGLAPRLVPNDLRMKSAFFSNDDAKKYPGVRDWPMKFSDLARYYRQAESEMGVAGNVGTDLQLDKHFGVSPSDAERGYPEGFQTGIPMTYLDQYIKKKLTGFNYKEVSPDNKESIEIPLWVTQVAQAKNAIDHDGRPACDGRGTCVPLCPSRAKYEALFHVEKAVKAGAELQANAVVTRLGFGASGEVTNVFYKDWQRVDRERSVRGRIVVLAANAIESPRIILFSEGAKANKVIGKYLMDHPGSASYGLVPGPVFPFRGPSTTSQIDTTREGKFRKWRAGFRTSLLNYGWQAGVLRGGTFDPPPKLDFGDRPEDRGGNILDLVHNNHMIGRALREKLRDHAHRQVFLGTALEQLPHDGNAVSLNPDKTDRFQVPLPLIKYSYDDPQGYTREGLKVARKVHEAIFKRLGATAYRLFSVDSQGVLDGPGFFGAGHIMGTTRMGNDGEDRAVDAQCRSVDHPNLYVVGSSVFVTGAVANPTLTIAALALRAADAIKSELRRI